MDATAPPTAKERNVTRIVALGAMTLMLWWGGKSLSSSAGSLTPHCRVAIVVDAPESCIRLNAPTLPAPSAGGQATHRERR